MTDTLNATPLKYGSVAPDFWLETLAGEQITRHQFRNKAALVVFLFTPSPAAWEYLASLATDAAEYQELNVKIIAIAHAEKATLADVNIPASAQLIPDPTAKAWRAYTETNPGADAAAVFVLDLYGGVDAQHVAASVADLPTHDRVLEWARGAQYRCNI